MSLLTRLHARFPKLFPILAAVVALGGAGAATYAAEGDCCYPGSPCCHPGAACCAKHRQAPQP